MTGRFQDEMDGLNKGMEEEEDEEEDWMMPSSILPGQGIATWNPGSAEPVACPGLSTLDNGRSGEKATPLSSGQEGMSNMQLNTNKAGMEGLDKEKINKIILENSKGSRFFESQKKREQQTTDRIDKMMEKLAGLKESEKQAALIQVNEMVRELERHRDLSRTIVHLDMDMFYAAVEMRDDPELREKPMAVGGTDMLHCEAPPPKISSSSRFPS